jgi:hypothetical protein
VDSLAQRNFTVDLLEKFPPLAVGVFLGVALAIELLITRDACCVSHSVCAGLAEPGGCEAEDGSNGPSVSLAKCVIAPCTEFSRKSDMRRKDQFGVC